MKKLLLFILISTGYNMSYAQLTNGQVYDFEIGDVFQATYAGAVAGPAPVETDTVIDKFYSSGLDTVFYVMNHLQYTAQFMQTPPIYNYSIDTVIVTNLNVSANHFTYTTCLQATDTSMIDNCGNSFERFHSNFDSTCFEPQTWYSDLYLGLGGPYYYMYDPTLFGSGMEWYSKTLTYYNSNQHGECGTFLSFVGLDKLSDLIEVQISPNPAQNELRIITEMDNWVYSIYSHNGTIVNTDKIIEQNGVIDISQLSEGYYFIQVSNDAYVRTIPFIKK